MRKREILMGNNGLSGLQVIVGFVIVLQGKKMDKQKSVKARKEAKSTTQQRGPSFSGYNLFIEEFYVHKKENQKDSKKDKQKGKGKTRDNFKESNLVVREAWNQLSEKERAEYKKRAEKLRAPGKGKSYVLPFMTRCAPKQFMAVCKNLKERPDVMKRLKRIGFDKLVEISCPQINRALCAEFMRCFDPPTKQVTIRGETRGVGPEDVRQILGLPKGGTDIRVEVDDGNVVFNNLRTVYKNLKYQTIGELLNGEVDENFEFLFVVFALGTLLAPTASIYVTDRVLKVMTVTKDAVDKFDWSSFVFKELSIAIGEYQRELKKGKGQGIKTVGGCIYFLMMFCFQHFGLGKVRGPKDEDALTFWNEERVKIRVQIEKESRRGLLYGLKHGIGQSSTTFNPETMLTHPELRRTYDRLVSMVRDELLALQTRLLDDKNIEEDEDNGFEEGDDEEDKEEAQEISSENDGSESEDKEEEKEKEEHDKNKAVDAASEEVDDQGYDHSVEIEDVGGHDGGPAEEKEVHQVEHGEKQKEGSKLELRRSKRAITASWVVKSPWIDTTKKSKGKRKVDDKDTLFQMCTTTCSEEEGDEEFVDMHDYFLTRRELYCLRPRGWINDRLMSMVARTLVEDQKANDGRVGRHIFSPDFMHKIIASPLTWSLSDYETQILPEHIGYNIGDCDFIFGPAVFHDHWFCYVIDTKTMKFYALDSLVDIRSYMRKQKELEQKKPSKEPKKTTKRRGQLEPKELMATRVVWINH